MKERDVKSLRSKGKSARRRLHKEAPYEPCREYELKLVKSKASGEKVVFLEDVSELHNNAEPHEFYMQQYMHRNLGRPSTIWLRVSQKRVSR